MPAYEKLIGASLGPGDPELITRRSWAVLQSDARWLYPVKKAQESSYALSIVERGGLDIPADAEELVFPMTRDTGILLKVKPLIDEIIELLARRDLLASSCFIDKVGSPNERIVRDVASLKGEKVNYLSLLLVQNPKRERGQLRRGCRQRQEAGDAA